MRMLFIYFMTSTLRGFLGGQQNQNSGGSVSTTGKGLPPASNLFNPGEVYDFYMYLSPDVRVDPHILDSDGFHLRRINSTISTTQIPYSGL